MRRGNRRCGTILLLIAACSVGNARGGDGADKASGASGLVGKTVVAVRPDAGVRLGPSDDAASVSPSASGHQFNIESRQGDWLQIADTPRWWIRRSDVVLLSEAIEYFTADLRRSPTAYAYAIRSLAHRKERQDFQLAMADAEAAIRLDPKSEFGFLCRAACFETKQEFAEAIADYSRAIALNPKVDVAYISRGKAHMKAKASIEHAEVASDFDDVIGDFSAALDLSPASMTLLPSGLRAAAYFGRAQLNQRDGKLDAAERDFLAAVADFSRAREEAVRLQASAKADSPFADKRRELVRGFTGKHAESLAKLGELRSVLRKSETALANLAEAIDLEPKRAELYRMRGEARLRMGDREGAAKDIDRALELAPDDVAGRMARAGLFYLQVRYFSAIEECTQVIQADPKHARAYYLRGHLQFLLRNYEEAYDDLSKAISLKANDPIVYKARARVSLTLRQAEKSLNDLNEAIRISPADAEAYQLRSATWKKLKKHDLAQKDLAEAKRLESIRK